MLNRKAMKKGMLQERYMRFVCRMFKYGKLDVQFVCRFNGAYRVESSIFKSLDTFLDILGKCVSASDSVIVTYSFDSVKYHELLEIIDNSEYSNLAIWQDVVSSI